MKHMIRNAARWSWAAACGLVLPVAWAGAGEPAPADVTVLAEVKALPYKIVFESFRENNWDLFIANPDGTDAVNLTRTPDVDDLYPHVSPDGTLVCFSVDSGKGDAKVRSLYYMRIDGSERTLVGHNLHQACWSPDGKTIAYLKGEQERFTYTDYATKGLFFYDLATKAHRAHPNKDLFHLYNICWSPDGKWFAATVHAGMGFKHAILAIEADGMRVVDLKIGGCRPDFSPDGKKLAWGVSDFALCVADFDFSGPEPKLVRQREVASAKEPVEVYHVDWSPDGKYIAFSRGPHSKRMGEAAEIVGLRADGWDICVADASKVNRWAPITTGGTSNKEPDWAPAPKGARQ